MLVCGAIGYGIATFTIKSASDKETFSRVTTDLMLFRGLLETLDLGSASDARVTVAFLADRSVEELAQVDFNSLSAEQREFLLHVAMKYKAYREGNAILYLPPSALSEERRKEWAQRSDAISLFLNRIAATANESN